MSAFGSTSEGISLAAAGTSTHPCASRVKTAATPAPSVTSRGRGSAVARRAAWTGSARSGGAIQWGSATGLHRQRTVSGTSGSANVQKSTREATSSLRWRTRSRARSSASQATIGER